MAGRDELEAAVAELVRPLVAADGGTIDVVSLSDGELVIRLGGACAGCPGAALTTSRIVEPVARKVLGAPVKVRLDHSR